jgi:hypothetical protein
MTWWEKTQGKVLSQGDLLGRVSVPSIRESFPQSSSGEEILDVEEANVIVITQSCDLERKKTPSILVAHYFTMDEIEEANPTFKTKGRWREVAIGRFESLYMLRCPENPENGRGCLVVDFRRVSSLPFSYVEAFAEKIEERWRLKSPYLEHLSQAFGRYFMRVALPTDVASILQK